MLARGCSPRNANSLSNMPRPAVCALVSRKDETCASVASRAAVFEKDNENLLHLHDPDACCALRKTAPLQNALRGYDGWGTGRKRYQGGAREAVEFFEAEGATRIKVNPLAHWGREDIAEYMTENRLPKHPLVAKGYPSIGCAPCTSAVKEGEDERSGRWRGTQKVECGIHFINGRAVRAPLTEENAA